jgi:hypothetical protein
LAVNIADGLLPSLCSLCAASSFKDVVEHCDEIGD